MISEDPGKMTFFKAASTMLKKTQTIRGRLPNTSNKLEPPTPTVKMADLVSHSK